MTGRSGRSVDVRSTIAQMHVERVVHWTRGVQIGGGSAVELLEQPDKADFQAAWCRERGARAWGLWQPGSRGGSKARPGPA